MLFGLLYLLVVMTSTIPVIFHAALLISLRKTASVLPGVTICSLGVGVFNAYVLGPYLQLLNSLFGSPVARGLIVVLAGGIVAIYDLFLSFAIIRRLGADDNIVQTEGDGKWWKRWFKRERFEKLRARILHDSIIYFA